MASLNTIPQEVLEHIAYNVGRTNFLGPPSHLVSLLATCRRINAQLSIQNNPHLYARIFSYKFDLKPALQRLGVSYISPTALSLELQERFIYLKRVRSKVDAYQPRDEGSLQQLLSRLYLWILESEWKNERQLREYANIDGWLQTFWFDYQGASHAMTAMQDNIWPNNDRISALGMWLYWHMLRQETCSSNDTIDVLRIFALAAHKYNLASPSWANFLPPPNSEPPTAVTHFGRVVELTPVPVAVPAILSFFTLAKRLTTRSPVYPSFSRRGVVRVQPSSEWDSEWSRCISLSQKEYDSILSESFRPGSIEGVWEGQFSYTEFTAYAALLAGAPLPVLQKSMVAQHQQTWKLREYYLSASDSQNSDSGIDVEMDTVINPLPAGDPLRSYFPTGTQIQEDAKGLNIKVPGTSGNIRYQRGEKSTSRKVDSDGEVQPCVVDVIVMGEGHSSWGQFNLIGRVRPCDGLISLSKEYMDGDRGKWLYRGYLIGNVFGKFAGRWRDTLTPPEVPGYEGCFAMSRRG